MRKLHRNSTQQLEVYIPNRDRHGHLLNTRTLSYWYERVQYAVCALPGSGGASWYYVAGVWGGLRETTRVIRSVVEGGSAPLEDLLVPVLAEFGRATDQECVALTLDGVWWSAYDHRPPCAPREGVLKTLWTRPRVASRA